MNFNLYIFITVVGWIGIDACEHYGDTRCLEIKPIEGRHFLNQWIVEIHGGEETAKIVARDTGFQFMEPASDRENHYFFTHSEIPRRHKMQHDESLTILRSHEKVIKVGQQYVWKPTLNQLEDYKEFVGLERPIDVVVTSFDPKERLAYYEEIMNRSIQPIYGDEVKEANEIEDQAIGDNAKVTTLPPLDKFIDLQGLYKLKEKMNTQMKRT